MAQTKRKRKSKHRGNAVGVVQARGRTTRPPSQTERKKQARDVARATRLDKPPSWSSSAKKASLAAVFMFVALLLINKKGDRLLSAIIFAVLAMILYVPAGYYMEMFIWRRRQEKKAAGG